MLPVNHNKYPPIETTEAYLIEIDPQPNSSYEIIFYGLKKNTEDVVEKQGIEKTHEIVNASNILLWIYNAEAPCPTLPKKFNEHQNIIFVANKIDLLNKKQKEFIPENHLKISCKEDLGINDLIESIKKALKMNNDFKESLSIINKRQFEIIKEVASHLKNVQNMLDENLFQDIITSELYSALEWLKKINSKDYSEKLLDKVFSSFCIGK